MLAAASIFVFAKCNFSLHYGNLMKFIVLYIMYGYESW